MGDDSVAIIGQHINTPPVAPTWHNGQCPRPLDALILRLLAKDPSERPESATDVLSALDSIELATDVGAVREPPLQDDPHALDSLAGGVFVGRQREMGELKACLEDALSGRGRLVTLVGEPGIGKTRTAQELATYAGLRGAQVLCGRCYEEQGMPPYWPWVQAIRSYVRERDPDQIRSEMGAGVADIAEVVSDIKERLPDLKPPPVLDSPEQARFRLFDSITAFLKSASLKQPLVLVLDDLHWADQPSLLLLQFVARELGNSRLLLVGTYRDMELSRQHPLAESLGELTRERLFQRVLLRGLSRQDVERFIEVAIGVTPPSGLTNAVHTQTERNPLFVTEVVRLLVQEGELTPDSGRGGWRAAPKGIERDSWTVRIPEGVREVIGRRLNRLSQRCNETLTIASVIGREFELKQLAPLVEDPSVGTGPAMSQDRLLEVLEEALSARVIEELPKAVGRYQFTHALIQETLSEELTLTRKVRLHARIAETLEELYGDNAEIHAAELAHHFAEAQTVLGVDKLVKYSLPAGERALAAYAWEEALGHFQRGLAAGEGQAIDGQTAELLFGLGRAEVATAEVQGVGVVVSSLGRAFDYYAETGEVERAVAVALEHPGTPVANSTDVTELFARALALVPADSYHAGRLLAQYGNQLGTVEGDFEAAQGALEQALVIARREGDAGLEMRTLTNACRVARRHCRWQQSLRLRLQAIDLAQQVDDPLPEVSARHWASDSAAMLGELEQAQKLAEAALAPAERLRHRSTLAIALQTNATVSRMAGDFKAARELSDRALAVSPQDFVVLMTRLLLDCESGELSPEAYQDRVGRFLQPRFFQAFTGYILGTAYAFEEAEKNAKSAVSTRSTEPFLRLLHRAALGLMAAYNADAEAAREQYAALRGIRGTFWLGTIADDRLLGLLCHTVGDLGQAVAHFEDALSFCRKGFRPELAWACCDYADTLLQRNEPGDREKAVALLDESLAISSELGMRPLMVRVLSRREILGA